jgi:proline iminopeptidase
MREGQLIEEAYKIRHIPMVIVQGRYDMICPMRTSWDLYQALGGVGNENLEYRIVDRCGHSASENGIREALVDAVEKFKFLEL